MAKLKEYRNWVLIGVLIVAAAGFSFAYTRGLKKEGLRVNKKISDKLAEFKSRYEQEKDGLLKTPTAKDQQVGEDFMRQLTAERQQVVALWRTRGAYLERGIKDHEVVADGTQLNENTFAETLISQYLQAMAKAENALAAATTASWQKTLALGEYANDAKMKNIAEAADKVAARAQRTAQRQAHIFKPDDLLPLKDGDNFRGADNREKRWDAWRQFLIFDDILNRALVKAHATLPTEVIGYERVGGENDPLDVPKTTLIQGENTYRPIQNLTALKIELLSVGNQEIATGETAQAAEAEVAAAEANNSRGDNQAEDATLEPQFHDVYKITVELTAHLQTIKSFEEQLLKTDELYYVPLSMQIKRFPEVATLGNPPPLESGSGGTATPNAEFRALAAVAPRLTAGYDYEPPVAAKLEYLLYRPRLLGNANPQSQPQ